jgi:hypothetical protein
MINHIKDLKDDFMIMKDLPNDQLRVYIKNRYKVFGLSIWWGLKRALLVFIILTVFIGAIHFIVSNTGGWWQ